MVNYDHPPKSSRFFGGRLYQAMSDDLQLAGMSKRTVHGYLRAVRQLADYCKRKPDKITEAQLRRYFLYLKNEKNFAYGSIRVAFSGIKFFYTRTCKRDWETLATMKLQQAKTLPEVLTIEQVHQIIDSCNVERIALFFWTTYSMGLRLDEARNLQVSDIQAGRGFVHIHRGKGAKDRSRIVTCRCPVRHCTGCVSTGPPTDTRVCCSPPKDAITNNRRWPRRRSKPPPSRKRSARSPPN